MARRNNGVVKIFFKNGTVLKFDARTVDIISIPLGRNYRLIKLTRL